MCSSKCSKKVIISSMLVILILSIFNGCSCTNNASELNIDDVKNDVVGYLTDNGYDVETVKFDENEFSVQSNKKNKNIQINYVRIKNDYYRCLINVDNSIENYSQKYNSINYEELADLSQILGIKKITKDKIKNTCEDDRAVYDSNDIDYSLPSGKIMSKINRVGFFENPVIIYELTANSKPIEIVTILWNS